MDMPIRKSEMEIVMPPLPRVNCATYNYMVIEVDKSDWDQMKAVSNESTTQIQLSSLNQNTVTTQTQVTLLMIREDTKCDLRVLMYTQTEQELTLSGRHGFEHKDLITQFHKYFIKNYQKINWVNRNIPVLIK